MIQLCTLHSDIVVVWRCWHLEKPGELENDVRMITEQNKQKVGLFSNLENCKT